MTFYRKHERVPAIHDPEEVTKQAPKDECDINRILRQYSKTGLITHINKGAADYAELPDQTDFQEALSIVQRAQEAFSELPALVRARFGNDPAAFLDAFNDPSQWETLQELGLIQRRNQALDQVEADQVSPPPDKAV